MRKSIFDLVAESFDIEDEVARIDSMTREERVLAVNDYRYYSLSDFVDSYCFDEWQHRGHCVDVEDLLETIDYEGLMNDAPSDADAFMTIIELAYNFWVLAKKQFSCSDYTLKWQGNFYHLKDVLDDDLQRFNHVAYEDKENSRIIVIEDKPGVTAVAEIIAPSLALDVIRYNHRSLKGEIEAKKSIILSLAADLEPKRAALTKLNKQLAEDIFFMLNNLNIRHNNRSKKDKNYKEYVAKMRKERLERWYDELYQMILLANLLLDNVGRAEKVKELKAIVVGGQI